MEGLTKDNFWNKVEQEYPIQFERFAQWTDNFKRSAAWEALKDGVKFHDLHLELQYGILLRFLHDENVTNVGYEPPQISWQWVADSMEWAFAYLKARDGMMGHRETGGIDPDKLMP